MPHAGVEQQPSLTTYLAEDPFALPPITEHCRHAPLFPIILLHFGGKGPLVSILSNLSHLVTFGVLRPSSTLVFLGGTEATALPPSSDDHFHCIYPDMCVIIQRAGSGK